MSESQSSFQPSDSYPTQGDRESLKAAQDRPESPKESLPDAAEDIARTVEDLRKGNVKRWHPDKKLSVALWDRVRSVETVVDATAIYEGLFGPDGTGKAIHYYEDHPCIAPPFQHALIAYQNGYGNIIAMDTFTEECDGTQQWKVVKQCGGDEPVEWDRVRWTTDVAIWSGGQGGDGHRSGTMGPLHMWRFAIYEDGKPADLSWVNLTPDYPMELWDMAMLVELGALNYLNCKNVNLVEPQRQRSLSRRIQRTGTTVKVLNVLPMSRSSVSNNSAEGAGSPLTSVRGHFSRYGPKYDKGLLFGKYEGMFWVPQFARGAVEHGEVQKSYKLKP